MKKMEIEFNLPTYLQKSIDDYIAAINRKDEVSWDLYYCDLKSSINMAEADNNISIVEANLLREYYL